MTTTDQDWTKPSAMAIPPEGYFKEERGRYGPVFPRTPACYGFSIIAKVKEGREEAVRAYGKQIEEAIKGSPDVLAPLRLHYLALGAVRRRVGSALPIPGHLRHRLRQVHRGRRAAVQSDRHHHRVHQSRGFPGGLEGEPGGVHQVRPRPPGAQLPRVRRIPLRHRRRDQEGAAAEGGLLGQCSTRCSEPHRCSNSTTSSTSC